MTSILNLSGLNYGASNPLRGEMNIIRDYIARVEKTVKELAAGGGGAITGAKGITAGLKEVALQIVNLRSEIENIKGNVTRIELNADSHQKRVDKAIADLVSRMSLAEAGVASTSGMLKTLNTTVSSLASGSTIAEAPSSGSENSDLLSAITEALAEVDEAESTAVTAEVVDTAPAEVVEANTQEDEAASEEILALLRSGGQA
jgi:hypothetical protein